MTTRPSRRARSMSSASRSSASRPSRQAIRTAPSALSGALRFAAYAYPPNALGYCGPDESHQLLEQLAAGVDDPDLRRLARGFEGAWPYLELIAGANGIRDPLDSRVVEAYWVGNTAGQMAMRSGMFKAMGLAKESRNGLEQADCSSI